MRTDMSRSLRRAFQRHISDFFRTILLVRTSRIYPPGAVGRTEPVDPGSAQGGKIRLVSAKPVVAPVPVVQDMLPKNLLLAAEMDS